MPYIFVDDGAPEAGDYASNYVWFDGDDPGSYARALAEARRRFAARWKRKASSLPEGPTDDDSGVHPVRSVNR